MKSVLVINGANMDLLGVRDQKALGADTLDILMNELIAYGEKNEVQIIPYQSNMEGELINKIHDARSRLDAVIINPGSFGHYSIGLKEALDALPIPCVEVHLANFFRKPENKSVIAPVCSGIVCGFGRESYKVALDGVLKAVK